MFGGDKKKKSKKMSKKRQQELAAEYVSPYSLLTPRGRRRTSLLIIVAGIALSHIWSGGVVQSAIEDITPPSGTTGVQWSR